MEKRRTFKSLIISKKVTRKFTILTMLLLFNVMSAQCWIGINTGGGYSISQTVDGKLWSTGQNNWGCLGNPNHTQPFSYELINNDTDWQQISAGYNHILTIKTDGSLWGWGSNQLGQLGSGPAIISSFVPIRIGTDNDWAFVSAGYNITMAIKTDGSLWGWGNTSGHLLGTSTSSDVYLPIRIGTSNDWQSVNCSNGHVFAKKMNGNYWGWGYGGLGVGSVQGYNVPTLIHSGGGWGKVSLGNGFSLLLKTDGTLWSTGFNLYGQLGDGSNVDKSVFVQVGSDTDWVDICAGSDYSSAKKADGTLWVWGNDDNGQLGQGWIFDARLTPVQLNTDTDWTQFSASEFRHMTALKTNGELWSWGSNSGEIGNGSFGVSIIPEHISCVSLGTQIFEGSLFSVYPNPAQRQLHINNPYLKNIIHMIITDVLGKTVMDIKENFDTVNLEPLQNGTYILQIDLNQVSERIKFIKSE